MKHWNLKRVLSLLLVVCMVTGRLSGVSAMAEDQTANYHEISTDGLKPVSYTHLTLPTTPIV